MFFNGVLYVPVKRECAERVVCVKLSGVNRDVVKLSFLIERGMRARGVRGWPGEVWGLLKISLFSDMRKRRDGWDR